MTQDYLALGIASRISRFQLRRMPVVAIDVGDADSVTGAGNFAGDTYYISNQS